MKHAYHTFDRESAKVNGCSIKYLPPDTNLALAEMTLDPGGFREFHWHNCDEYLFVTHGRVRVMSIDPLGKHWFTDGREGNLLVFSAGVPHSIESDAGAKCLLTFRLVGEFQTFLWGKTRDGLITADVVCACRDCRL